jgi:glycosyltransferase involved in cell wall biosynthesis
MKHISVLVSNDLQHDQRVNKVCHTLVGLGFDVTLIGRILPGSQPYDGPFRVRRFRLPFYKGALFYATFNVRLFFYLIFAKTDVILANDLDTLAPAFCISRLRKKGLVYDSHEYFTEAEGLTGRPIQKGVWSAIEAFIFPKLKHVITVNESIANIYRTKYKVPVHVVRNVPLLIDQTADSKTKSELDLPENRMIILLQGNYIDPDRGGMELVEAFQYLPECLLVVIGAGRDYANMVRRADELHLTNVVFKGKLPYHELMHFTRLADVGVSLDKPLHLNYTLSLPNKLFDYLHAGIPVLVSDLPELRRIVEQYQVGKWVSKVEPVAIAEALRAMQNEELREAWQRNTKQAKLDLNWQHESKILATIYQNYL